MFKIVSKTILAPQVKRIEVEALNIARRARPGQFVVLRVNEKGERIPLTIAGQDSAKGTITLIFQEIGKTTRTLGTLNTGDSILDLVGPLGHPTKTGKLGTVVVVGGGVGVAEVLPVAKAFKDAGNTVIGIIGARNRELVILETEMRRNCDALHVTTDDGSYGRKGFVSDVLQELLAAKTPINAVYAIGPVPMMKVVANVTRPYNLTTVVSLNPIMVDGTGMCGACRVSVAGKTKFACVDGPEFDGHQVNWEELIARLAIFKNEEKISLEKCSGDCRCQGK